MNGDAEFDRLVSDSLSEPMSPDTARELDGRIAELVALHAGAQPRGRHLAMPHGKTRTVLLLVAAVFIVVGCVVVRDAYGTFEDPAQVDTEMADARAVTPIPPGATWPPMHTQATIDDPDQPGATLSVGYSYPQGHLTVEYVAACMWDGYWLDGYDRSDSAQMSVALAGLEQSRTWIAFSGQHRFGVEKAHAEVVDAAERGDPAPVRKFMTEFGCSSSLPSAGSSPSAGS